jgi:small subunit ribosomal protein S21
MIPVGGPALDAFRHTTGLRALAESESGDEMGLRMRVHDREPIGAALRRFKKLLERSGLKKALRAHEYYEKPCEARRRQEGRRQSAIRKAALLPRK